MRGALVFYTDINLQQHRLPYTYDNKAPLVESLGLVPPFQLYVPDYTSLVELRIYEYDTDTTTILTGSEWIGYSYDATNKLIIDKGASAIAGAFTPAVGQVHLEIEIGTASSNIIYYSEVFCWELAATLATDQYAKIEWCHNENITMPDGGIVRFDTGLNWVGRMYLNSGVNKPSYQFIRETEDRDGEEFSLQNGSFKVFRIGVNAIAEYQLDVMRLVPLYDIVQVTHLGRVFQCDKFEMNDPNWQEEGDIGTVLFEFRANTLVLINGRSVIDNKTIDTPAVTIELGDVCTITSEGSYDNKADAVTGGVLTGEYYDLLITNDWGFPERIVLEMNAVGGVRNRLAGFAAYGYDACFTFIGANDEGFPVDTVFIIPDKVPAYANEAAAAAAGVAINEAYVANDPVMGIGVIKIRYT